MKTSNKLIIISASLLAVAFLLLSSGYTEKKSNSYNNSENGYKMQGKTSEIQNNISKKKEDIKKAPRYCLKISDGKICAYMICEGEEPLLWNTMELPPTLGENEINALKDGIYTESFEEMCLYFESYAS